MKKLVLIVMAMMLACGVSQAVLYTNFVGSAEALPSGQAAVTVQNTLNFTATPGATGDVFQVIGVPSNCIVLAVGYNVTTTNTAAGVFQVGDGGSVMRYKEGGSMATPGPVLASGTAYMYSGTDTIDVKVQTATMANGVITVWAVLSGQPRL